MKLSRFLVLFTHRLLHKQLPLCQSHSLCVAGAKCRCANHLHRVLQKQNAVEPFTFIVFLQKHYMPLCHLQTLCAAEAKCVGQVLLSCGWPGHCHWSHPRRFAGVVTNAVSWVSAPCFVPQCCVFSIVYWVCYFNVVNIVYECYLYTECYLSILYTECCQYCMLSVLL